MPKIMYEAKNFRSDYLKMINQANEIIDEYYAQGFDLTLRQLYYQFVARGLLENNQSNYKKLGNVVNDGRLAGKIDWNRIEDRTRGVEKVTIWESPEEIIQACVRSYKVDLWEKQPFRVEVWIEKEALAGVFERICTELRVPYLSCRGYTSQSEMWRAGQRLLGYVEKEQTPLILHFGDHDPSGIDMSRDIESRLQMFLRDESFHFQRLALNMNQVEQYNPPPNPAKLTDTRATSYIANYGDESWELDALDPTMLSGLVRAEVENVLDTDAWGLMQTREQEEKDQLQKVSEKWNEIVENLED